MARSGDEVDGWRLLAPLGEGHFSPVWRAQRGEEIGALKMSSGSDDSRERLVFEAAALGVLDHPGIPKLLDANTDGDVPYLVMQEARGETLLDRVNNWNKSGRVHGEVEALNIVSRLMSAVAHVHSRSYVHRDIKDANIMLDGETPYLIDFGFCKPAGSRDGRIRDSFWRAGAARFGPLSKLNDPVLAVPSHDVYATGVIAYRLLTGYFPYGEEDSLHELKERYATLRPSTAHEVNRMVSPQFSRLIDRMITQVDNERINSAEASTELEALRDVVGEYSEGVVGAVHGRLVRARRAQFPHVVRDPIGGDIRLTDLEYRVLNTAEMQRLRWIRQLGLTNLVYPGADHSRLSHSIGTVHTAETMMRAIEDESGVRIDADVRATTRLFALTHDVSHIPCGHTIEDQLGLFTRHDENIPRFERLVNSASSELGDVLRESEYGRAVVEMLNPAAASANASIAFQAVAGSMGADVLDYLDRDAYFCGLDHRVDSAIYRQLTIDGSAQAKNHRLVSQVSGKYGIRTDRTLAIDHLLEERYAMFLKVYTHSAKIAADAVLGKALSGGTIASEVTFESLGDETLLRALSGSRKAHVPEYADMLSKRRLPRGVFRTRLAEVLRTNDGEVSRTSIQDFLDQRHLRTARGRTAIEAAIAKEADLGPDRVFFYVPVSPPGYQRAEHWVSEGLRRAPHQTASDLSRRHLNLWEIWVFVDSADPQVRKRVGDAAGAVVGLANMIELPGDRATLI